ncbi:MAG: 50S ribosomal protein L22 [Candidatus Marinimicrobia bacterium]|nr:50S ribosomal protein L22 [Candidatus Neomarinimicrobiota bacterium]|tara:strand:+ start:3039 stop:3392 length:354 start_codon:yes stop_codon:yes gene_type:complete
MDAVAKSRFVRQSAKKVRKTLGLIRGQGVETALNLLHFAPQKSSGIIEKTINSAVANYIQSFSSDSPDTDDLIIKEVFVDEGPTMRRFRPASMGRSSRIRKRSSHITVIISSKNKGS